MRSAVPNVLLILGLMATVSSPAAAQAAAPRLLAFEAVLQGEGEAELRWPVAVAAGSTVEIAVADAYRARLVIFSATGGASAAGAIGGGWSAERTIPLGAPPLAMVHDGRRYVVALRGRGELTTIGNVSSVPLRGNLPLPPGTVPGALAAMPDAGLLVYDAAGGRVLALDDAGRTRAETPAEGHVTALAAAPGGFYAAFAGEATVRRYAVDGRIVEQWQVPGRAPVPAWPDGIVVDPGGGLLLADRHGDRILALDGAGRLAGVGSGKGWKPGRLLSPAGIARLPDGRLVVADRGNGRVQIFRRLGRGSRP